jgi:hypothetical protein
MVTEDALIRAIATVLLEQFSDPAVDGIRISESEAFSIAHQVLVYMQGDSAPR